MNLQKIREGFEKEGYEVSGVEKKDEDTVVVYFNNPSRHISWNGASDENTHLAIEAGIKRLRFEDLERK